MVIEVAGERVAFAFDFQKFHFLDQEKKTNEGKITKMKVHKNATTETTDFLFIFFKTRE